MAALEELIRRHPNSAAPHVLLAQALWRGNRREHAEQLLRHALPTVAEKSEILDTLASMYSAAGEHAMSTAYYLLAAHAMGRKSTLPGCASYLSGVYSSLRPEAARTFRELAELMSAGTPVKLDWEQAQSIDLVVRSNAEVRALAESAWEGLLKSKAWHIAERAEEARKFSRERVMAEFRRCLRSIAGFDCPLEEIADAAPPAGDITWDNSEALRTANRMSLERHPETRAAGIRALEDLVRRYPASAAPRGLLGVALWRAGRRKEAEALLREAVPAVAEKSDIFDSLANGHSADGEHAMATAYYLLAAYSMGEQASLWGGVNYLSGVYSSLRPEAARTLHDLAAVMRGGHPVDLERQHVLNITLAVQSNADLRALAEAAWEGFLESKARQMLAGYASQRH